MISTAELYETPRVISGIESVQQAADALAGLGVPWQRAVENAAALPANLSGSDGTPAVVYFLLENERLFDVAYYTPAVKTLHIHAIPRRWGECLVDNYRTLLRPAA